MGNLKIKYLIIFSTLFINCYGQKDGDTKCEISTNNVSQAEYDEAIKIWMECLVAERIKEKSKAELYNDIRGTHIEGPYLFLEDKMSDVYLSYKALSAILSDKELKENLQSNDPAIKYYSFWAVTEKEHEDVFELLKTLINDTTKISTNMGCIIDAITIADLCINRVTEKYVHDDVDYKPKNYQLTVTEKAELDELVLNSDLDLQYKKTLLSIKQKTD